MPVATQGSSLAGDSLQAMVECWTAVHGLPRRFQRGESTDFFYVQGWLYKRDYALSASKGKFTIQSADRSWHGLSWRQVIELVDELRCHEGLEPYRL